MYTSHQNEKKTEYGPRAREVENSCCMSTSGGTGMGKEVDMLVRQIATKLSVKRG